MAGELGPEIIENVVAAPRSRKSFRPARRTRPPAAGPRRRHPKGLHARLTRGGRHRLEDHHLFAAPLQDDVKEVNAGMECGVLLADTNDIKPAIIWKC